MCSDSTDALDVADAAHVVAILDTVGEAIITIDESEVIHMMNAEANRIFGIERGAYDGQHVHVLMPERYRAPHSDAFYRYIESGQLPGIRPHVEVHGLRADGSEFPLELRFTSVTVGGRVLMTAAARDITVRKQRLQQLDDTIAQLQERIQAEDLLTRISRRFINVPVASIGPGIDEALRELGEFFGVDRAFAVIVPDISRIDPAEDTDFDVNRMISMAHEWCADGVDSLFDAQGRLYFHQEDSPQGRVADSWFRERFLSGRGIRLDSLDDLPAEVPSLRRRLEHWGVHSRIAVPIVSEGVSNGILGLDSVRGPRTWGDGVARLLSQAGPVFAAAVLRKRSAEALAKANAELEQKVEERTRELRDKQAQLVRSEKLASLGQLVAGVAHEVNTPLGAIKSNNDTVLRALRRIQNSLDDPEVGSFKRVRTARKLADGVEKLANVSEEAIERITTLVRSLRSFARLDQAELDEVDIHQGLDTTLTLLHHELKARIKVERHYGELPKVRCFPNQLNQVFMNVLVNAVQAIEGKGRIVIRSRASADEVTVEITDSGRGIAPENLPRIFDPGYTSKGVGVGTGLGLSIVHQILERHRGAIDVQSEPGKGTTVTIRVPSPDRS